MIVRVLIWFVSGAENMPFYSTMQWNWISVQHDVDYFAAHLAPAGSDL